MPDIQRLTQEIQQRSAGCHQRYMIGIAGPPASGKSTFVDALKQQLNHAVIVPMDGFHLDNAILARRGLMSRKGSPDTFDAAGYFRLLQEIKHTRQTVYAPQFDRSAGLSRGSAIEVLADSQIILAEGNYLLLNQAPWSEFKNLFDLTIFLNVPMDILQQRLLQRWRDHGLAEDIALNRTRSNDLPNASIVIEHSYPADYAINNF